MGTVQDTVPGTQPRARENKSTPRDRSTQIGREVVRTSAEARPSPLKQHQAHWPAVAPDRSAAPFVTGGRPFTSLPSKPSAPEEIRLPCWSRKSDERSLVLA